MTHYTGSKGLITSCEFEKMGYDHQLEWGTKTNLTATNEVIIVKSCDFDKTLKLLFSKAYDYQV